VPLTVIPTLPADAVFAAAAEGAFAFVPPAPWQEQAHADSPDMAGAPCLLAVPLIGALATQPPTRMGERRRGRWSAFRVG
jgi:hypothetical protein